MTFKKILVAMMGLCLLGTGTVVAATPLQKECKKVVKQLKKEGWQVADKSQTLEEGMTKYYDALEEGGIGVVPVIGNGQSKSFNLAQNKAKTDATAQLAKMRGTELKRETEMKTENTTQDGKTSTKTSMDMRSQSKVNQNVKAFVPIVVLSRTGSDGNVAVRAYYIANVD